MEIKILHGFIHDSLKPWTFDLKNTRRLVEIIKEAQIITTENYKNLSAVISVLLQDHPVLQKELVPVNNANLSVRQLPFAAELPDYSDTTTHYFKLLIDAETLRVFNFVLDKSNDWKIEVDVLYHIENILTNIKTLSIQTADELQDRGLTTKANGQSDVVHYTLYYLKHSLIALYFSIQEEFKTQLTHTTTLKDFYLHHLQERVADIVGLQQLQPSTESVQKISKKLKLSFDFKGHLPALKTVLNQLTATVDLVNENLNTVDDLYNLLTAREIVPGAVSINIGCETVEFRYIIDRLKPYFSRFKPSVIEQTASFKSNQGNPFQAQNLYSSKIDAPKRKEDIDSILKQMK